MLQPSVSGPDPLVDQIIQIRQKRRTLGFDDRRFRTVQIHQIGDLGRHESGRTGRASQKMLLQLCCGFRQPMGQRTGSFQSLKGERPAMLPMKSQPRQHRHGCHHPEQSAIRESMKSAEKR